MATIISAGVAAPKKGSHVDATVRNITAFFALEGIKVDSLALQGYVQH